MKAAAELTVAVTGEADMQIRIRAAAASDIGRVRKTNEDAFGFDLDRGLFIVCDGVGGSAAGEVASRSAVDCMLAVFPESVDDPNAGGSELERAIQNASGSIFKAAQREPLYAGMATTIVASHFDGARMWIAHVGDSRGYLLRDNLLHRLTDDHSALAHLLREGNSQGASAEEMSHLDSILTQALGASELVVPSVTMLPVELGDCFLLATDGITKAMTIDQMRDLLLLSNSPEDACLRLTEAANDRGGEDNSTCVLIQID